MTANKKDRQTKTRNPNQKKPEGASDLERSLLIVEKKSEQVVVDHDHVEREREIRKKKKKTLFSTI